MNYFSLKQMQMSQHSFKVDSNFINFFCQKKPIEEKRKKLFISFFFLPFTFERSHLKFDSCNRFLQLFELKEKNKEKLTGKLRYIKF
jgi:hypothetical protein